MHITRAHTCARYACKRRELELIIIVRIYLLYLRVGMVSGGAPHLISVAKYNKYALRGVLGFDAKGGHITYENT